MRLISIFFFFFYSGLVLFSQNDYGLGRFEMKIKGTSSLHDWTINAHNATCSGTIVWHEDKIQNVQSLNLEIPVKALISEKKNKKMDDKTKEALNDSSFPIIQYKLKGVSEVKQLGNAQQLKTKGTITVAGVSREEDLVVLAKALPDGTIAFTGEKKLLMTDYKIKPPKAMMGLLTTGNEVNVSFDITMSKI